MAGFISTLASTKVPTVTKFDRVAVTTADDSLHRSMIETGIVKRAPVADRTVVANVSTGEIDRAGDQVVQRGIDYSAFMKLGGTVLWQHDANLPIARAIKMSVEGDALVATVLFPPAGISSLSDEIYGLIRANVINCTSIGFKPKEFEPLGTGGYCYKSIELMEFSFVSVPANRGAGIVQRSAIAPASPSDLAAWCQARSRELVGEALRRSRTARPRPDKLTLTGNREIDRLRAKAHALKVRASI